MIRGTIDEHAGPPPAAAQKAETAEDDDIRSRLLDAAVRVFAREGYEGTRILDIVREAGLSTGAVYSRFSSKDDLLREAVVRRARTPRGETAPDERVADLIVRGARIDGPLDDDEAVRLEAYVAAPPQPEVADALVDAGRSWHAAVQPLIEQAKRDGSVAPDVDPEAVLYLVSTLRMGLLVQRAAGFPAPDPRSWTDLLQLVTASFGTHPPADTPTDTPTDTKGPR